MPMQKNGEIPLIAVTSEVSKVPLMLIQAALFRCSRLGERVQQEFAALSSLYTLLSEPESQAVPSMYFFEY